MVSSGSIIPVLNHVVLPKNDRTTDIDHTAVEFIQQQYEKN
jgi:hypothetical protein